MKKFIVLIVCVCLVSGFVGVHIKPQETSAPVTTATQTVKTETKTQNMKGVWISFYELRDILNGKSQREYTLSVQEIINNIKAQGLNTVFYQVRAFCDSFYLSDIFPADECVTGEYDPFKIFVDIANKNGIKVHAWINPFRVSYDTKISDIPKNSPVLALYNENKSSVLLCSAGIYLNPCEDSARRLALSGVREILEKYNVDGIHFDDYFYPESDIPDKKTYSDYKKQGGTLSVEDFRRESVSAFVGSVYSLVKSYGNSKAFSISPCADIDKCKNIFFADVELWTTEKGYADYIIPQIYYGFQNESMPFEKVCARWESVAVADTVSLVCGLAPYKQGVVDAYAGSGKNEWVNNGEVIENQIEYITKSPKWQGYCLFSYSYII